MSFLRRVRRVLADLLTSKKAIATIGGVIAHQLGADPTTVIAITGYVIGQGIADHGKEAAKKYQSAPVDKNGQMVAP